MQESRVKSLLFIPYVIIFLLLPCFAFSQAIMGTTGDGELAVVFPTPGAGLPTPTQNNVTGMPANAAPHGVSYFGSNSALVSDFANNRVYVVQISSASVQSTINTPNYNGTGTIAVAPTLTHALAIGNSTTLNVIHAPFNASSTITTLTLPNSVASYQTQAIVFDNAGRAFIFHITGISVLDPPYTSIAFTIPLANASSGAIAISPNGNRLLVTTFSNTVQIFSSPYSASSTPSTLTIVGASGLDGIMVAPNGNTAIVAAANSAQVYAIAAPFSNSSTVQQFTLPAALTSGPGFEDVGISADSQLAIITGNSLSGAPAAFIEAPFTTAGATVHVVTVNGPGRGAGAVRFLPPGLAEGLTISKSAPSNVNSGSNLTYTLTYSNTSDSTVNNVIIRDPIPAGTTFVSATGGGAPSGGDVVWNIGNVPGGTLNQTVTFTVNVTASSGTIENVNYSIEGDSVSPIFGPPVFTTVGGGGGGGLTIAINNVSQFEGDSGTSIFQFQVTLSDSSESPVTVHYQTAPGTATAGVDYESDSGNLTFNSPTTSLPVQIVVNGDKKFEPNETFFVNLSNASGASILDGQGVGTILNDDGLANIVISPQNINFGQVDVGTLAQATITITNRGTATGFVEILDTAIVKANPSGVLRIRPGESIQVTLSLIVPDTGNVNITFPVVAGSTTVRLTLRANGVRGPLGFTDISQQSGIANQNVETTGVQWIDFNGDGLLDLQLVGSNGNALFRNNGDGTFTNVTNRADVDNNGRDAEGASWADIDNDGDLDLFIANLTGFPTLLRNDDGEFVDISDQLGTGGTAAPSTRGGIWLDFNNDADIDLFVVKDGSKNQLFKRIGFAEFRNVANNARIDDRAAGRSAIAADFNNDGFQDIYVVNFNESNKLYLNNGDETFQDITTSAGVGFSGSSVQAAAADFDRDQDVDLLVVNSEGPSVLYRNDGNLEFTDVFAKSGLKSIKKGVAAAFADYDGDADEDLVFAQTDGGNFLFRNNGKGRFKKVKNIDLSNPDNPTGVAVGDFNNDGFPDIAIADGDSSEENGDSLYENTGGEGNNFLNLILEGSSSNRSAIGAKAIVQTGLLFQAKTVSSGDSQNQQSLPLEFGLGPAEFADTIQILWPSGTTQTLSNVAANQTLTVREE